MTARTISFAPKAASKSLKKIQDSTSKARMSRKEKSRQLNTQKLKNIERACVNAALPCEVRRFCLSLRGGPLFYGRQAEDLLQRERIVRGIAGLIVIEIDKN